MIVRLLIGTVLVIAILVATFALIPRWTPTWGATEAEVARTLPGDELIERAPGDSTHAVTIDAPPQAVWPWIAQIGDDRGGFYSYTFIENPAQQMMMGGEAVYHNANRILPEFQSPQPGEGMIADSLQVYDVDGQVAVGVQRLEGGDFGGCAVAAEPAGANQTRLLVRRAMRLFPDASASDVEGGRPWRFVMEADRRACCAPRADGAGMDRDRRDRAGGSPGRRIGAAVCL
jgi:hypothetical protein